MKKTDKKIENTLRKTLTQVCEVATEEVEGFSWITHLVNYRCFPESLSIICVFNKRKELSAAIVSHQDDFLRSIIREKLAAVGIHMTNTSDCIVFDSEEACSEENAGNWDKRLF